MQHTRRARVAGELDDTRRVGGQAVPRRRGRVGADRLAGGGRVAERVRAPLPPLRAVADLHQPALQGPRKRAGPRAAGQQRAAACACRTTATTSSTAATRSGSPTPTSSRSPTLPKQQGSTRRCTSSRAAAAAPSGSRSATSSTGSAHSDPEHDQPRRAQALRDSRRRPVGGTPALHPRMARALPPRHTEPQHDRSSACAAPATPVRGSASEGAVAGSPQAPS